MVALNPPIVSAVLPLMSPSFSREILPASIVAIMKASSRVISAVASISSAIRVRTWPEEIPKVSRRGID